MASFRRSAVLALAACVGMLGLGLATEPAHAAKIYKWTDKNGITHYGDSAPDGANPAVQSGSVKVIPVIAEPRAVARLRLETRDGRYLAFADNNLAGPIEVLLQARDGDVISDPPLPARATVPANGSILVAVLDGSRDGELRMDSLPGDPNARPRDYEYLLPTSVHEALASTTLLFLGYHLEDLDLKVIMRGLLTHLDLARWGMLHVAVQLEADHIDEAKNQEIVRYFQKYFSTSKIDLYWGSTNQFMADLYARWQERRHG